VLGGGGGVVTPPPPFPHPKEISDTQTIDMIWASRLFIKGIPIFAVFMSNDYTMVEA
jgi:hypothetical protein